MRQALSFVERLESKDVVHHSHNQQEGKAHLQNSVQLRQLDPLVLMHIKKQELTSTMGEFD
jgi:hypothetical protein